MGPESRGDRAAPSQEDCVCPVCLEIFVEPVTLPCTHTFCKTCFLESVDKAALCCPLCRRRVSTWARQHGRTQTLVNQELWTHVQTRFPRECERRLSGQEDTEDGRHVSVVFHRVSEPGEVRQEYEDQVTKLVEERRVLEEEERRASESFIQRLLAEEQQQLQEEKRRREEDERLARQLSQQLNSPPAPQEQKKELGQIEKYLCPRPATTDAVTFLSVKENMGERPVPKPDHQGPERRRVDLDPASPKRRSSEMEEELSKRARADPVSSAPPAGREDPGLWAELQGRRRQEEEDRRLALLLQKELNQEERSRATDRRKGSTNAYALRQSHDRKLEAGGTPRRTSQKKTCGASSSAACGASSIRGKQTVLTEMFSNMSRTFCQDPAFTGSASAPE